LNDFHRFVIRNLPSSTKVQDITIRALTQNELKGKFGVVTWGEVINNTLPSSRYYQIEQEIQRVSNHIGEFIDTDFYTVCQQYVSSVDCFRELPKNSTKKTILKN
jgi:hypothetical protein